MAEIKGFIWNMNIIRNIVTLITGTRGEVLSKNASVPEFREPMSLQSVIWRSFKPNSASLSSALFPDSCSRKHIQYLCQSQELLSL